MTPGSRALTLAILTCLAASCGSATEKDPPGRQPTVAVDSMSGSAPSPADSCGQAIGGDNIPPVCAQPQGSPGETKPRVIAGPVTVEPGVPDFEIKLTVTGSGSIMLSGGTTSSETLPSSGSCSGSCTYLVNGATPVMLTPGAGYSVFDPASDQNIWPSPCSGRDGRTTCEFDFSIGVIMNTDMRFFLRPTTAEPKPLVTPTITTTDTTPAQDIPTPEPS